MKNPWIVIHIVDDSPTRRVEFWTGPTWKSGKWSEECPDAWQFSYREAYAFIRSAYPGKLYCVKNYGQANEKRIEPNHFTGY
jgi:hypothetical protein